ncbi:MAG TPA: ABC transporter substrate-binding protein [Actinomycetota bacterium]|nr:ABC transporter substrate-binding protein [Actinomycetota bacterium]
MKMRAQKPWGKAAGGCRLVVTVLMCVAIPMAGCNPAGTSSGGSAEGAWTYVDGSGRETRLDSVPKRIVAHGNAAAALIPLGVRPVGIYADGPVEQDLGLKGLDLEGIEIVGEEWGVINVEAVAALRPDLIVAEWWPLEKAYSGLEEGASAASKQIKDIAPIAGPAQGPSILQMIQDYEELASALGADLDSSQVKASRDQFERARSNFQSAIQSKPNLSVLAVSPSEEGLYVAVPEHAAELADFMDWGLDIVVPEKPDPGFEYWETLSWENAGKYQADLVIVDERSHPANLDDAKKRPTWRFLKAAQTEAVAIWPAYWVRNYADYSMALDRLTEAISAADENLV